MRERNRRIAWVAGTAAGIVVVGAVSWAAIAAFGDIEPLDRAAEKTRVRELGARVESLGLLPGFADFLVATAKIESQFNPRAGSSARNNAARGWFGMRPASAFNSKNGLSKLRRGDPNLIKSRPWAVALAADYTRRVIPFADPGQTVTYEDLRRSWKFPKLIADSEKTGSGNRAQFLSAAKRTGVPITMLTRPVVLGDWPGILPLVESLGGELP